MPSCNSALAALATTPPWGEASASTNLARSAAWGDSASTNTIASRRPACSHWPSTSRRASSAGRCAGQRHQLARRLFAAADGRPPQLARRLAASVAIQTLDEQRVGHTAELAAGHQRRGQGRVAATELVEQLADAQRPVAAGKGAPLVQLLVQRQQRLGRGPGVCVGAHSAQQRRGNQVVNVVFHGAAGRPLARQGRQQVGALGAQHGKQPGQLAVEFGVAAGKQRRDALDDRDAQRLRRPGRPRCRDSR